MLVLNIVQKEKDIYINQGDYITKKIEYVDIKKSDEDTLSTQLSAEDKRRIWQAVGKCRLICNQTRPDIYENLDLYIKQRNFTYKKVKQVNNMIKRAKKENFSIRYCKITSNK